MTALTAASGLTDPAPALGPRPRWLRLDRMVMVAVVGTVVGLAAWLAFGNAAADDFDMATGIASPIVDILAALLVAWAALHARSTRSRLAWGLIAGAMACYAVADGLWSWISFVEGNEPFPSGADVAYLAFYPIVAVALLLFPAAARARREAVRLGIDSAIIVVGGGMLIWHSLLQPALSATEPDPIRAFLTLGYPVGDLVVLLGIAAIALRRPAGVDVRAMAALIVGLILMFVADATWGELVLAGDAYAPWVDVAYLASTGLIALAGFLQARSVDAPATDDSDGLSRWLVLMPYAGLAAGFGVLLAASGADADAGVVDLVRGAAGLTILVLIRQELVNRENARLLADRARRDAEARYRSLEQHGSDAYLLVDADGVAVYASPSLERVLDVDSGAVIGSPVSRLAHASDADALRALIRDTAEGRPSAALEWRLWTRSGAWRLVETVPANLLDDPAIGKIVLTTRDVRERNALRQQAMQATLRDVVTGLPNRMLFRDRVTQALHAARRDADATVILLIDLDEFKRMNGRFGHASGDEILREVGQRLTAVVRAADTVARLGGDEFAILLDGPTSLGDARDLAGRVLRALLERTSVAGTAIELNARIGIASASGLDATDASTLLRNADVALLDAKARGLDRIAAFETSMQSALEGRFQLEADLRLALERNELVLQYQPIVDLETGELVSAEALVRWDHPTKGRLGPDAFIPLAEETGLIGPIGLWVLRTACAEVATWARAAPGRVPRVSVNLAAPQIADPQLAWIVQNALAEASAAPGWLTLEVTESMLIVDTAEALRRLHAIRALGVQISVDDFGTGYSSLAYLQQFPLNHIKIDRSFVTPLDDPSQGPGLAAAIVEIGRALGMTTVAEGIETELQRERLQAMGCTFGQGFLFAKPLDGPEIVAIVTGARAWGRTGPGTGRARSGPSADGRLTGRRRRA